MADPSRGTDVAGRVGTRGVTGGRPTPAQRGTATAAAPPTPTPVTAPRTVVPDDGFGPILPITRLDAAQRDPTWVERGITGDALSSKKPYLHTLTYDDGATLAIPLELMSYRRLQGPTVTFFRRHLVTGRVVPFQASQTAPTAKRPELKGLPALLALQLSVPPRFDPALSPFIIQLLDQAQWLYLGRGMLEVFQLQLMNPVIGGFRPRLIGTAGRGLARAGGLTALQLEARGLAQIARARTGKVVVNLCGSGEVPGAINVNSMVSQQAKGVPNLLKVGAERVGELFPAGTVDKVVANNVILGQVDWMLALSGSAKILRSGGTVAIAPFAAQYAEHVALIEKALIAAGFRNLGRELGYIVTAVRP